ncbi:MAG: XisI protein [Cyanobacteria bacterium P01_G01_bin.49]
MDNLDKYRAIITQVLTEYASIPYACGELERKLIVDSDRNNFLLLTVGWQNKTRVHGCLVHLEIIDDKVWIQQDGIEDGITNDLLRAGISKDKIVLAFHPPSVRPHTKFAVS